MGEAEYFGGGLLPVVGEIVVKAGKFKWTPHLTGHDLRADPSLAHQEPAADQFVHGLSHSGAGQVELGGEVDFVFQAATRFQEPTVDGRFNALYDLMVEGDGGGAIDV